MSARVRRAPVRLPRTCKFRKAPEGETRNAVTITEGKEAKGYWLTEFPAEGGRGFKWETFEADGGNVYCVLIAADGKHTCECLGHLRWGHRTVCRHVACTLKLIECGKL